MLNSAKFVTSVKLFLREFSVKVSKGDLREERREMKKVKMPFLLFVEENEITNLNPNIFRLRLIIPKSSL